MAFVICVNAQPNLPVEDQEIAKMWCILMNQEFNANFLNLEGFRLVQ